MGVILFWDEDEVDPSSHVDGQSTPVNVVQFLPISTLISALVQKSTVL